MKTKIFNSGATQIECNCGNVIYYPDDIKYKWCSTCKNFIDPVYIRRLLSIKESSYSIVDYNQAVDNCVAILQNYNINGDVIRKVETMKDPRLNADIEIFPTEHVNTFHVIDKLRKIMLQRGITIDELEKQTNLTSISQMLVYKGDCKVNDIRKIEEFLGVKLL